MSSCKKCGLQDCICFVEDIPDAPFYHGKWCIRGPNYKITTGKEMDAASLYERFAEKWYETLEEARTARKNMMLVEKDRMLARIAYLDKELSA